MSANDMDLEEQEDEKICRYCFDGEEESELISPCKCSGGQKWVHLKCLRQWQRMVLVTQPTHPAFHDRDLRHQTCNVCKSEFTCAPPTRHELMASFTGPEIAALIGPGCIIASHDAFSAELESQLQTMPPFMRGHSSYDHWIRGVFLITKVDEDDGSPIRIPVDDASVLESICDRFRAESTTTLRGRRYKLAASGDLEGVAEANLVQELGKLTAPCVVVLTCDEPANCGNDHVVAVNLTRVTTRPPRPDVVEAAVSSVCAKYRSAAQVEITHFLGGPCDEDELMACLVLGGGGQGWTVVKDLNAALELAHTRAVKRFQTQGDVAGGQTVRLKGLKAAPELNGGCGFAICGNFRALAHPPAQW